MAHTCPDCGNYCTCNGDFDDIDFGELSDEAMDCIHWKQCERDDDYNPEDYELLDGDGDASA